MAVNTLLTVDDYAYMLEHSRAQVTLVSAALLPTLWAAMPRQQHEIRTIIVPGSEHAADEIPFRQFVDSHIAAVAAATTHRDDIGFWLYSSGPPGAQRAPHARQPVLDGRAVRGARTWSQRRRCLLLGSQAVLRLRPWQRAVVSAVGGCDGGADGRATDTRRLFSNASQNDSLRFSLALQLATPACLPRRVCRRAPTSHSACAHQPVKRCRARLARSGPRTLVAKSLTALAPRRCICTSSLQPSRRRALWHHWQGSARLRGRTARRNRPSAHRQRGWGISTSAAPSSALMYWNNRENRTTPSVAPDQER